MVSFCDLLLFVRLVTSEAHVQQFPFDFSQLVLPPALENQHVVATKFIDKFLLVLLIQR